MVFRALLSTICLAFASQVRAQESKEFFESHCISCHSGKSPRGGLDLSKLTPDFKNPDSFARWVKVHDRIAAGEMPPKTAEQPAAKEKERSLQWMKDSLLKAELDRLKGEPRTLVRRMTRSEFENTMRDLFDMPGLVLREGLPEDGSAHGFDNNSDALDISHVNLAKYMEAVDKVLDHAIVTQPQPPVRKVTRVSVACDRSSLAACILEGDGVMLRDKKPDPNYPPAGKYKHLDYAAHLTLDLHQETSPGTSVGVFRHEDDSFRPSFVDFVTIYPGRYRIKTAFWSFRWEKGKILPAPSTQTARLDVWHLTGNGLGTGHPSTLLGYFDAPSLKEQTYEMVRWLNTGDSFGFNFTDSYVGHEIRGGKDRLLGWSGNGLAVDHLEIEGPIHEQWPPVAHRRLFGDLPLQQFKPEENRGIQPPRRQELTQRLHGRNQPDPPPHTLKLWTIKSDQPLLDADKLLASFLPRAFRRPVSDDVRKAYVGLVERRMKAGDCFEIAMRKAYRAALCSPDFLYHVERSHPERPAVIDDYALASRLSYFLWNTMPDDRLLELAAKQQLNQPAVLKIEVERLLKDPRSHQFRDDFLGQWLKLRKIAANDPDPKLYGGFRVVLQDAMVAETRSYFQEMLDKDLGATYLVKSDFVMVNGQLAKHYGIQGVTGSQMRRVPVPEGSCRGPFLTQAAVLKVTANGTTTSPVVRGAFVMDRLLGRPPEPPPPNIPAVEPDVRGAVTIREQLALHRNNATCASCHAKMDPPGFALESFDVIGRERERYQSITQQKPKVDPSGVLADGRKFSGILEFQNLVASEKEQLLKNLAERLAIYSLGRGLGFSDRDAMMKLVKTTQSQGGGLRTLIHELIQSDLFKAR